MYCKKMLHANIIILLISSAACSTSTLKKCCSNDYSVYKDYGYQSPELFQTGNLHCRHNPESNARQWIPRYFNISYEEIDVPDPSTIMHSVLSTCAGYDIKMYVLGNEGALNCSEDGNLVFNDDGVEGNKQVFIPGGSYCVDTDFLESQTVIMACSCPKGGCVQYCCGDYAQVGVIDQAHNLQCNYSGNLDWSLQATATQLAPGLPWVERSVASLRRDCNYASHDFNVRTEEGIDGFPETEQSIYVLKYLPVFRADEFYIEKENALLYTNGKHIEHDFYCVAPAWDASQKELVTAAFYCQDNTFRPSNKDIVMQSWFAGFGALFSLMTVLGMALSPELRKGPEGVTLFAHCIFMLSGYIAMSTKPYIWTVDGTKCLQLAHVLQFLFLSAFFWLNVRAIIIFTRFRSLETMLTRLSGKQRVPWVLPLCVAYALGVPALVCGITVVAQRYSHHEHRMVWADGALRNEHEHEIMAPSWLITPDISDTTCWFGSALGRLMYYTLPMGLVLLMNLGMFISTVTRLAALTRGGAVKSRDDLRSDKRRLILFVKMFVVMGLSWSGEFLSFANYFSQHYWYFSSATLTLRAAAVFIIFCCRRKVWNDLRTLCCKSTETEEEKKDPEMSTTSKGMELTRSTATLTASMKK